MSEKKTERAKLSLKDKLAIAEFIKEREEELNKLGSWADIIQMIVASNSLELEPTPGSVRYIAKEIGVHISPRSSADDVQLTEIQELISEQRKQTKLLNEINITLQNVIRAFSTYEGKVQDSSDAEERAGRVPVREREGKDDSLLGQSKKRVSSKRGRIPKEPVEPAAANGSDQG